MDNKTKGIIATVATVLLCGCPGVCIILVGAFLPSGFGNSGLSIANVTAYGFLCLGIFMFMIPIVVAFISIKSNKNAIEDMNDEEIPPAI